MLAFFRSAPTRTMRLLLMTIAVFTIGLFGCGEEQTTTPIQNGTNDTTGVIHAEVGRGAVQFEFVSATNGDPERPIEGPFAIRGSNILYDTDSGALSVDMTVVNLGDENYDEPVTLTFISLLPEGVTVENSDNDESGPGAMIQFEFANRDGQLAKDGQWTPDEESLPRTTLFGADQGTPIAFVSRIDVGMGSGGMGSIGGIVWDDANGDGVMDEDESGQEGVAIALSSGDGEPMSTTSGSDGTYRFDGLDVGLYIVTKKPLDGYVASTPMSIDVILVTDQDGNVNSFLNADFGCQKKDNGGGTGSGSISGSLFEDTNRNRVRDEGEAGIADHTVDLAGTFATTVQTDENGDYVFKGLEPGEYVVTKSLPEGFVPTTPFSYGFELEEDEHITDVLFGCVDENGPRGPIHVGDCVYVNGEYVADPDRIVARSIDIKDSYRDDDHGDDDCDDEGRDKDGDGDCDDDDEDCQDKDGDGECDDNDGNRDKTGNWGDHDWGDWDWGDWDWDDWDWGWLHGACKKGDLRGPVTAIDHEMGVVEIMGTAVKVRSSRHLDFDEIEVGDRIRVRVVIPDGFGEDDDYLTGYDLKKWNGTPEKVHGFVQDVIFDDSGNQIGFIVLNTLVSMTPNTDIDD